MGLLERALQYKQRLNDDGRETLIDTIKGPAETDFIIKTDALTLDAPYDDFLSLESETDKTENTVSVEEEVDSNDAADASVENEIVVNSVDRVETDKFTEVPEIPGLSVNSDFSDPQGGSDYKEEIESESEDYSDQVELHDSSVSGVVDEQNIPQSDKSGLNEVPYFDDYMVLFEIQKELYKNQSVEEVFSTILFSVMGQMGVSSASILFPGSDDKSRLAISDSIGLKVTEDSLFWERGEGILEILENNREVLDIENFKNNNDLREEFFKFVSIDTRLLAPMISDDELIGAVSIGEKINGENFSEIEIDFLNSLAEISANVIAVVEKYEKAEFERLALRIESEILSDVEIFQNSLLGAATSKDLGDIIRANFYSLGLESYAVFMEDGSGAYYPAFFEEEDILEFNGSGFVVKEENRFISFLIKKNASIIVDDFNDSSVLSDTFGRERMGKMEQFIAYPFVISGRLTGFISIFKINPAVELSDIDIRIRKVSKFIFPYINRINQLDPDHNIYNDMTVQVYGRIEHEMRKAEELGIPLTMMLLSVKNYKRYYDRYGRIETNILFNKIASVIKSRLSSGDFSSRIDRQKFIITLPGKDKNYAANFSSILKNEIANYFAGSDFKLLISFITAEYPQDGSDLYSLLDVLD